MRGQAAIFGVGDRETDEIVFLPPGPGIVGHEVRGEGFAVVGEDAVEEGGVDAAALVRFVRDRVFLEDLGRWSSILKTDRVSSDLLILHFFYRIHYQVHVCAAFGRVAASGQPSYLILNTVWTATKPKPRMAPSYLIPARPRRHPLIPLIQPVLTFHSILHVQPRAILLSLANLANRLLLQPRQAVLSLNVDEVVDGSSVLVQAVDVLLGFVV